MLFKLLLWPIKLVFKVLLWFLMLPINIFMVPAKTVWRVAQVLIYLVIIAVIVLIVIQFI